MITKREDVAKEDCWNVEALFPTFEAWEKEFNHVVPTDSQPFWPKLVEYRGKLGNDVKVVKVNIMNVKGKLKRQGRYEGYTKKRRKAIVTLSADSKEIKLFNEE